MTRLTAWLDMMAQLIARDTGLDMQRVRHVIGHTVRDPNRTVISENDDLDPIAEGLFLWPDIREAARLLHPERALQLFEELGAEPLLVRVAIIEHWNSSGAPLYRISELIGILKKLRHFLLRNRNALLENGYATEVFTPSLWLWSRVTNLYPIKVPEVGEIVAQPGKGMKVHFHWTRANSAGGSSSSGVVDYSEAPLIEGLSLKDAARLQTLRSKVLEFKLKTLEILEEHGDESTSDVIARFTSVLRSAFEPKDSQLLLKVDHLYSQLETYTDPDGIKSLGGQPGGIADWITLVFLVEERARSRVIEDLRDTLDRAGLMAVEPFGDPRPSFKNYFEVVDSPQEEIVEGCMQTYWELGQDEPQRLEVMLRRIAGVLPADVVIRQTVLAEDAPRYSALVGGFADFQSSHLAATGRLADIDMTSSSQTPANAPTSRVPSAKAYRWPHHISPGTQWESVLIQPQNEGQVRILLGGKHLMPKYSEMGFSGPGGKPSVLWFLFQVFIREGQVTRDSEGAGIHARDRKMRLARLLRNYFFGISGDPFHYTRKNGWEPRFQVCPDQVKPFRRILRKPRKKSS